MLSGRIYMPEIKEANIDKAKLQNSRILEIVVRDLMFAKKIIQSKEFY